MDFRAPKAPRTRPMGPRPPRRPGRPVGSGALRGLWCKSTFHRVRVDGVQVHTGV